MKGILRLFAIAMICFSLAAIGAPINATQQEQSFKFVAALDAPISNDRILYHALQRIGYTVTMDAASMENAIRMANDGECDGLSEQRAGIDADNLIMVPEEIGYIHLQVIGRKDKTYRIKKWEDLKGLRVGSFYQKSYIQEKLPKNIKEHIQMESLYQMQQALLNNECDVLINTIGDGQQPVLLDDVEQIGILDTFPTYTYLNKKYKNMIPLVTRSIQEMKADGMLDEIKSGKYNADKNKTILHISSYYPEDTRDSKIQTEFGKVFEGKNDIKYYNVPLYSNRFYTDYDRAKNAYSAIRTMLLAEPPDVLIVTDNNGLTFVNHYYDILFGRVPIVYMGVNNEVENYPIIKNHSVGIKEQTAAKETVAQILKLYPDTKNLFIINDSFAKGIITQKDIEQQLKSYEGRLNIIYDTQSSLDRTIDKVKKLSADSIILLGNYTNESKDIFISRGEIYKLICKNASVPVFSLCDVGFGEIGGKLEAVLAEAEVVAKAALELTQGKGIDEINLKQPDYNWVLDESVMTKWSLAESDFPEGAVYINQPESLYESNPEAFYLIIVIALLGCFMTFGSVIIAIKIGRKNRWLLRIQNDLHTAEELLVKDKEIVNTKRRMDAALAIAKTGIWEISTDSARITFDYNFKKMIEIKESSPLLVSSVAAKMQQMIEYEEDDEELSMHLLLNEASAVSKEVKFRLSDGSIRYYNLTANRSIEDGTITGMMTDITERMEQSRASIKMMSELLNKVNTQLYVSDVETDEILFMNNQMCRSIGMEGSDDVIGQTCWKLLKLNKRERCENCPKNKLNEDPSQQIVWFEHSPIDQQYYQVIDKCIEWFDGRMVHFQQRVDVTDMKIAREMAEKANAAKSDFLSNMSHEMRTPMNAIIGMTAIALKDDLPQKTRNQLNKIESASTFLLYLINNVLDMSKIEADKFELSPGYFSLDRLLADLYTVVIVRANEKHQQVEFLKEEDIEDYYYSDAYRIMQVITNLLYNAIKFSDEKTKITLKITSEENSEKEAVLRFDIIDRGVGIEPDALDKIFVPFEQVRNQKTVNIQGTGLGLTITKKIVELMDGEITVQSKLGEGSTFSVKVKLKKADEKSFAKQEMNNDIKETLDLTGKHILLVEDVEINREIVIALLQETHVNIDCAENGLIATQMVEADPDKYQLVLMDVQMPVMNGYEASENIVKINSKIPIVSMTASAFKEDIEKALASGMVDHMAKPVDEVILLSKIKKYIL